MCGNVCIHRETCKPHTAFHYLLKALTICFHTNILRSPMSVAALCQRGHGTSCTRLSSPLPHSIAPTLLLGTARPAESCWRPSLKARQPALAGDRLCSPLIRLHYFYYPIGLHTRNRGTCPYLKLADTRRICWLLMRKRRFCWYHLGRSCCGLLLRSGALHNTPY